MIAAFAQAPVSVVQPVSAVGLAILLIFSHFYLKERLRPAEWLSACIAFAGVLGLGVSSEPEHLEHPDHLHPFRIVMVFLAMLAMLGFILARRVSLVWAPLGLLSSVLLTSSGFMLQTRGLKAGSTVVVCTMAAVASMVTGGPDGLATAGRAVAALVTARLPPPPPWVWRVLPLPVAQLMRRAGKRIGAAAGAHHEAHGGVLLPFTIKRSNTTAS
ncbi:probable magnesium transporter, partial [Haematococcus lacustris]